MSGIRGPLSLLGRLMLCAIFIAAAGNDIPNFKKTVDYMEKAHIPNGEAFGGYTQCQVLLAGAIGFLILGSLLVIVGFKARFGAFLLFVFLVAATYFFHRFWEEPEETKQVQMFNFLKNVGLAGAMLLIMANGVGPCSLDNKCKSSD